MGSNPANPVNQVNPGLSNEEAVPFQVLIEFMAADIGNEVSVEVEGQSGSKSGGEEHKDFAFKILIGLMPSCELKVCGL